MSTAHTPPRAAARSRVSGMLSATPSIVLIITIAVAALLLVTVNLYLAGRSVGLIAAGAPAVDWTQYTEAGRRALDGRALFAVTDTYAYHYSPLLAYAFVALSAVPVIAWRAVHMLAALAMPTWPMRVVVLLSWPFWYDVETGNVMVFVVLAAAWALRGSRVAGAIYLLLVLLIPRPLMLPVAAWLLWRQPALRAPFAVGFLGQAAIVVAGGWAVPWLSALFAAGGDVAIPSNIGPSRFVGTMLWLLAGVPLAIWLTWRGRLGLASLAASPYWLPYYVLMLVLELPSRVRIDRMRWRAQGVARP